MNTDGSGQTNLTNTPGDELLFTWLPDSKHIIFSSWPNGEWGEYIMNIDGTGKTQIKVPSLDTSWSWDGKYIAFSTVHYPPVKGVQIYVANVDGTGEIRLTNDP
jgi:hypothetical protein